MSSTPPPPSSTPAGWYPDYADRSLQRYWDGAAWTAHTAPAVATAPPAATASQLPTAQYPATTPYISQPTGILPSAPSAFAAPMAPPFANKPTMQSGLSGKAKGWVIAGSIIGALLLVGGVANAVNGGRTANVAVAETATPPPTATPTPTPVPTATVEPVVEPPAAVVVDVAAFQTGANKHTADIDKDLDDMAVTLAEGGTWRLLSNTVEISFNLGQLETLDVPASIAAEWAPALIGLDTSIDTMSTAIAGGDPATIQGTMDGVRASAAVLRDIASRAV